MNTDCWINDTSHDFVQRLLWDHGAFDNNEQLLSLSAAGAGNMNVTLRARSDRRSVIVKQSRPFVAKYDFIPAPEERIHFEARFYQFVEQHPALASCMPRLLGWIPERNVLILEDLGSATDATSMYSGSGEDFQPECIERLARWLRQLHDMSTHIEDRQPFHNRALRKLNHAHIFEIPFQDPPAIDLDAVCPGLATASQEFRSNPRLREKCRELGEIYLSDGDQLLHGDFYPGSWLLTERGPYVIDPEFCFMGRREFDLGVMAAHLKLSAPRGWPLTVAPNDNSDRQLVESFAAVEVLRRLLGVAQLPLRQDLAARVELMQESAGQLLS